MELKFKSGNNPEISTPAAHRPKQIGVFIFIRAQKFAVGGYNIYGCKIVDCHAVFS